MSVNDGNTVSDEVRKRLLDGLEMRKHTAAEFDALAQMNKELIEDEESRNPMSVAELRERLERYVNDEGWTLDVFVSEGQTVGYITFRYEANPVGPNCQTVHLKQFYISREHRRLGLGTAAIALFRQKRLNKGDRVALEVLEMNSRGRKFWQKLGFVPYAKIMEHVL